MKMIIKNENLSFEQVPLCDTLRNLLAFAQFKKREKHPWRSVNFSKLY